MVVIPKFQQIYPVGVVVPEDENFGIQRIGVGGFPFFISKLRRRNPMPIFEQRINGFIVDDAVDQNFICTPRPLKRRIDRVIQFVAASGPGQQQDERKNAAVHGCGSFRMKV